MTVSATLRPGTETMVALSTSAGPGSNGRSASRVARAIANSRSSSVQVADPESTLPVSASDVVAVNVSPDLRTEMEVSAGRGVPDARVRQPGSSSSPAQY